MLEELKLNYQLSKEHLTIIYDVILFTELSNEDYTTDDLCEMITVLHKYNFTNSNSLEEVIQQHLYLASELCEYEILKCYVVEYAGEYKYCFKINDDIISSEIKKELDEELCKTKVALN